MLIRHASDGASPTQYRGLPATAGSKGRGWTDKGTRKGTPSGGNVRAVCVCVCVCVKGGGVFRVTIRVRHRGGETRPTGVRCRRER